MRMRKRTKTILGLSALLAVFIAANGGQTVLKVRVQTANVRESPETGSPILAQVKLDALLESLGESGDWYIIKAPADAGGGQRIGYILKSSVQVLGEGRAPVSERKPAAGAARPAEEPVVEEPASGKAGRLFGGFALKFGYMTSPKPGGFNDAYLFGLGYDIALGDNFALNLEFQPAYRSFSEIGLSLIEAFGWARFKGGLNLGKIVAFLKPVDLYAGAGLGGAMAYASVNINGASGTSFQAKLAYSGLIGLQLRLASVTLLLESQWAMISDPSVDPDFWRNHIIFGVRF